MKPRIHRAFPLLAVASLTCIVALPGCGEIGKPSKRELGATKLAEASAKARKLTQRIAASPEAAGAAPAAEGETPSNDPDRQMLAPSAAAEELRRLAGSISSVGDGTAQQEQAAALARRLKREAAMLDLMALERVQSQLQSLAATIVTDMANARSADAAAGPNSLKASETTVQMTRAELDLQQRNLAAMKSDTESQASKLAALEASAKAANAEADAATAAAEVLRAEVATSAPSAAKPKLAEAVVRMQAANALRKDAAMKERDVTADRGIVHAKEAAVETVQKANEWLAARLADAEKAKSTATARNQQATRAATELRDHATKTTEQFLKVSKEEFQPLLESTREAFEGNLATKTPTDGATLLICKARLFILAANNVAIVQRIGTLAGAPANAEAQLQSERDKMLGQAKGALIEARDSLSGTDSDTSAALLKAIQDFATACGMDLAVPPPPAAPAEPAAPSDAPADASGGGAAEAPAAEPPPSEPPAGDPPAGDPPPSSPPPPDEPNK